MNAPLIQQAAAAAAGAQQYPKGALYIVATPIGNLADISLRAVHVLGLADAVACEDTRVTAGLLRHLGLDRTLLAVHEHNESQAATLVIERLTSGQRVAYASDAGTPAVSDPGARLVSAVRAAGHRVVPVPGASSVTVALSAAGAADGQGFRFVGFAGSRANDRATALAMLAHERQPCVLFEAPHRIQALADALAEALPDRLVTICRELTKQFETIDTLSALALPHWLSADSNRLRGEFVLVLHGLPAAEPSVTQRDAATDRVLRTLLAALPLKQAVALTAQATDAPRNALYERALQIKQLADDPAGP